MESITDSASKEYLPGEDEAGYGELPVRGSLLELVLGANAVAAADQICQDMGHQKKGGRTQPELEGILARLPALEYPNPQVVHLSKKSTVMVIKKS